MKASPLLTESDDRPRDPLPILFLAVGHAGIKLISHLPKRVPELMYAALDTDRATLDASPFENTLLAGEALANGLGTGGNAELALRCAEEREDAILGLLQGCGVLILVAGLGGGTGGGIGPFIAERAREMGLVVISALVQPLEAEGNTRRNQADIALAAYREAADAVMLFPLDALKVNEDSSMLLPRLLQRCGVEIGRSLGGLAVLLRSGWLIPLTLQDVVQMMRRADGYCRLVAVSTDGEDQVPRLLDRLFTHPLIDKGSLLAHSGGIVVGMLCGPQTPVKDLERISLEIRRVLRSDAELKIGVAQDERFGRYLGLVVMVAERWSVRPLPPDVLEREKSAAEEEGEREDKGRLVQGEIELAAISKGRFKDIEPTIVAGADLDTPTFIRKGLKLSFHKERSGR